MKVHRKNKRRNGFTYIEVQVALLLFGIAISGLVPMSVMQTRQTSALKERFDDETTYYLEPSSNGWARRLGAPAIVTETPVTPDSPPVTLVDNGDPGYSDTDWYIEDWWGFGNDLVWWPRGNGDMIATWDFSGLQPGEYEVFTTWLDGWAKDAPYTVYDGATAIGTVKVDQKDLPSGPLFMGEPWESLGVFTITGDSLRVELSNDANEYVVGDAVRIVLQRNQIELLSVIKSIDTKEMTVTVLVTPPP